MALLDSPLRRICAWRVPPHWSRSEWFEEMKAQGIAAAWQAVYDFDPERGVPLGAFVHQRVMTSALTRHRQEWAYAMRCGSQANEKGQGSRTGDSLYSPAVYELLRDALARLSAPDRWLIVRLFWEGRTEAEIAAALGISHQAVSKRKRAVLQELRVWLETSKLLRFR
jgi:RNA polymerase sigma factor (sigma-70 family)